MSNAGSGSVPSFTFVDLFAGVGGFHHALAGMGGRCVFASDIDELCRKVYAASFPDMSRDVIVGDIRSFTLNPDGTDRTPGEIDALVPDHDVLCAGFPCQPFSKSGAQRGVLDETRGTLFFDIAKIVEAKRPRYLMLENVRNLTGPKHADTWATIIRVLRELRYRVSDVPVVLSPHLLPPETGGVPQTRDRVFILAARVDDPAESVIGLPLVSRVPDAAFVPSSWRIEDWLLNDDEIENVDAYRLRPDEIAWLSAWQALLAAVPDDVFPSFPLWVDSWTRHLNIPDDTPEWKRTILRKNHEFYMTHRGVVDSWLRKSWKPDEVYRVADFPPSRRKFEWQARTAQPTRAERDLWSCVMHFRPSGIRVKPATYLPALVAITQTSIIGSRRRRITPVEAGMLQGLPVNVFPDAGVDDATAYRQAGNGVNVGVVRYAAAALFEDAPWETTTET